MKSQLHPDHLKEDDGRGLFGDLPSCKLVVGEVGVTVSVSLWIAQQKGLV